MYELHLSTSDRLGARAMKLPLNSVLHIDGESIAVTITKILTFLAVQEV